ncbi:S8/S53 family peptidase [Flindersiella endophytica]
MRAQRAVFAAVTAVIASTFTVATAAQPPAGFAAGRSPAESRTVTLVTGDRVTVSMAPGRVPEVHIRPGAGRERIGFQERRTSTSVRVVPADAGPLIAAGRLDERLFDVTGLIDQGYDDARRKDLPLIVAGGNRLEPARTLRITRALPSIRAQAVRVTKDSAFWTQVRNGTGRVWLDGRVRASLDQSVPQIGAPDAWRDGYTGAGVKVAILDTGIDSAHPDLADAIVEAKDFTGSPSGTRDLNGHGTHVASIVTGNGAASNGRYQGVAPDAELLAGKVLGDDGFGSDSQIIAGMEWATAAGARVVNLSLGRSDQPGADPMEQAVNSLTAQTGVLFVIAAGNQPCSTVSSPAAADAALTVGAVDKQDGLAGFSCQGPRLGDHAIKPDLTAPGAGIVAARAGGTNLGDPVDDGYTRASGTSMATPHVAGTAAILLQQHPDWTAAQLKPALTSTAKPNPELSPFQQGNGRVDVARAVAATVHPDQAAVSVYNRWPHEATLSRDVSYRNDSDQTVTLDLAVELPRTTIEPARLTVPAHGSAAATLRIVATNAQPGDTTGALTATIDGGETVVARTALGLYTEPESYDVTATVVDRTGKDISDRTLPVQLTNLDTREDADAALVDGRLTARVPKGTYELFTVVETTDPADGVRSAALMTIPELVIDQDRALRLDARSARQVTARAPSRSAVPAAATLSVVEQIGGRDLAQGWSTQYPPGQLELYATPTEPVTSRPYEFGFHAVLAEPVAGNGVPATYHLVFREPGRIPERLAFRADPGNLAEVDTHLHAQGTATDGNRWDGPFLRRGDRNVPLLEVIQPIRLPEHRTDYYSTAADLIWGLRLDVVIAGETNAWEAPGMPGGGAYRPGRRYRLDTNAAAVGTRVWSALRDTDQMYFSTAPGVPSSAEFFQPQDGEGGFGKATLTRDGELIGTSVDPLEALFTVPPGAATYRLRQQVDRDVAWSKLGTRSDTAWTFRWNGDSSEPYEALRLMSPRVSGAFDDLDRAPAGRAFALQVEASWAPAEDPVAPGVEQVDVAASYDDGRSWHALPVERHGDTWRAVVQHPAKNVGTGFVSLRTSIVGTEDNRVDQTVIRAYQLK